MLVARNFWLSLALLIHYLVLIKLFCPTSFSTITFFAATFKLEPSNCHTVDRLVFTFFTSWFTASARADIRMNEFLKATKQLFKSNPNQTLIKRCLSVNRSSYMVFIGIIICLSRYIDR